MNLFAARIQELPRANTPFDGLDGLLPASPHGQAVFFRAEEEVGVPPHSHGAQWGIVVSGRLELTIGGETGFYKAGDAYNIGTGEEHSAYLGAGTCVVDVFQDPDRCTAK